MADKRSSLGSNIMFTGILVLVVAIFAIVMLAMGARLDNQDPAPKPASAAETARQDAAIEVSRIHTAAQSLEASNEAIASLTADSERWLDALGDVWIPWPDGAPEGYSNPEIDLQPEDVSPEALATDLQDLANLMITDPPIDADLATSIATSARIHAQSIVGTATEVPVCPAVDYAVLGQAAADGVSLDRFETSRQWLEVVAAQGTPGERQFESRRMEEFTLLTEAIIDAGTADTRPALAPRLPESPLSEAYDLATSQFIFLSERATPEARDNMVNFMCHMATYPDTEHVDTFAGPFPGLNDDQLTTPEPAPETTN